MQCPAVELVGVYPIFPQKISRLFVYPRLAGTGSGRGGPAGGALRAPVNLATIASVLI